MCVINRNNECLQYQRFKLDNIKITILQKVMQSSANQIKQAIRQLPIHERAVAIALKNIFDQVKALTRQEQQEIDSNHLSFISKFKVLQKRASDIIQGKNMLKVEDLDTSDQFFSAQEEGQKASLLKQKYKIDEFWYKAIANSEYGTDLTKQQQSILKAVTDLQTNIITSEIELILTIEKNDFVSAGVFRRRLVLDNGMPISFQGEEPKWIGNEDKVDGVFTSYILSNTKAQDQLTIIFSILGNLINQIVPYSLEYYLGAVDQQDDEQGDEEEGDMVDEADEE